MSKILIDKEKLEARIAELKNKVSKAMEKPLSGAIYSIEGWEQRVDELKSILQQGEEYNETWGNWIDFDENKPKLATYYLTYNKQGIITISVWNHKYWKSLDNTIIDDITHFMSLPSPPQKR